MLIEGWSRLVGCGYHHHREMNAYFWNEMIAWYARKIAPEDTNMSSKGRGKRSAEKNTHILTRTFHPRLFIDAHRLLTSPRRCGSGQSRWQQYNCPNSTAAQKAISPFPIFISSPLICHSTFLSKNICSNYCSLHVRLLQSLKGMRKVKELNNT